MIVKLTSFTIADASGAKLGAGLRVERKSLKCSLKSTSLSPSGTTNRGPAEDGCEKERKCLQCVGEGRKIEEVNVMKYLGAIINEEGSREDEVESRIGVTCRTIGALRNKIVD